MRSVDALNGATGGFVRGFFLLLSISVCGAGMADMVSYVLQSPYEFGGYQHKVQLHTHTTNSDGDHTDQWVMQAYEALDYIAVTITDHDYPGRTTVSLDDPGGHGIIHIPGVEYSADILNRSWNHMLGVNIATVYHDEWLHNRQAQINQAHADGGLAFLCHPYDEHIHRRGWDSDDVLSLVQGYDGIEIHNGGSYHDPGGRDYPYKVDLALTSGRHINVIAVDDFHRNPSQTMDRGYVVVNSHADRDTVTRDNIIAALKVGNYFSAGRISTSHPVSPRFTDITVQGHVIAVTTDKPSDVEFITAKHNYYLDGPKYAYREQGVTTAHYTASHDDQFIRVKATFGEGAQLSYAWSNPIYVALETGEGEIPGSLMVNASGRTDFIRPLHGSVTFAVQIVNAEDTVSCQWYKLTDNKQMETIIDANDVTYTIDPIAQGHFGAYQCQVNDNALGESAWSPVFTLTEGAGMPVVGLFGLALLAAFIAIMGANITPQSGRATPRSMRRF